MPKASQAVGTGPQGSSLGSSLGGSKIQEVPGGVKSGVQGVESHDTRSVGGMFGGGMFGGRPYLPPDKVNLSPIELQERFGKQRSPVIADEAWVATIPNFSRKDARAEKWILVNYTGGGGSGTMTFLNTFDGFAGENQDQDSATQPLNLRKYREKTAVGYKRVAVEDCPIAVSHEEARRLGLEDEVEMGKETTEEKRDEKQVEVAK